MKTTVQHGEVQMVSAETLFVPKPMLRPLVAVVIKRNDYIGLDMLTQTPVEQKKTAIIHVMLENGEAILPALKVEVSVDGYNWVSAEKCNLAISFTGDLPFTCIYSKRSFPPLHLTAQRLDTSQPSPRSLSRIPSSPRLLPSGPSSQHKPENWQGIDCGTSRGHD